MCEYHCVWSLRNFFSCQAARSGSLSSVNLRLFLEYGAFFNVRGSDDGNTTLLELLKAKEIELACELLRLRLSKRAGMNIFFKVREDGQKALSLCRNVPTNPEMRVQLETLLGQAMEEEIYYENKLEQERQQEKEEARQRRQALQEGALPNANELIEQRLNDLNQTLRTANPDRGFILRSGFGFFPSLFGLQFQGPRCYEVVQRLRPRDQVAVGAVDRTLKVMFILLFILLVTFAT